MSDLINRFIEEGMMWESPIKVMHKQVKMQMEEEILKAVQEVGIVVDKEELMKALKHDREQYKKGYADGFNANKWIPCSERLPEEDKMSEYYEAVNVTLDNGRVTNGFYRNRDKEWWVDEKDGEKYSINATGHVIAWQPLPEPYKGE